jgi:hypothetical protein
LSPRIARDQIDQADRGHAQLKIYGHPTASALETTIKLLNLISASEDLEQRRVVRQYSFGNLGLGLDCNWWETDAPA